MPEINPDAKNPLYADPMCLGDAVRNMRYLIVDLKYGYIEQVTLASEWRIERGCSQWPGHGYCLLADATNDLTVDLCLDGIHPHSDGRWTDFRFAVRATDEKITALYSWLRERQYNTVADNLRDQFPRHATALDDDSLWQSITKHLSQPAQ